MKTFIAAVVMVAASCLVALPQAQASMIAEDVEEIFLGGDGERFELWEEYQASFGFNLTETGDLAILVDDHGNPLTSLSPSTDVTGYDPTTQSISAATLNFTFYSEDMAWENISISAKLMDGEYTLYEETLLLGNWWGGGETVDVVLNLFDEEYSSIHLADYLQAGKLLTMVLSPTLCIIENDFAIEQASLVATVNPVPVPAAVWILGSGLAGLVGFRKRLC